MGNLFGKIKETLGKQTHTLRDMSLKNNTGRLDTSVASGARSKYTKIRGGGNDTVTIMVYMCGTDLESRSGMASRDLQEMLFFLTVI